MTKLSDAISLEPAPVAAPRERRRRSRHVRRIAAPRARFWKILLSFIRWNLCHIGWRLLNLWDTLRGRGTLEQKAVRLSSMIVRTGVTGAKIGQQVGMRIDLMPFEFSMALFSIVDRLAPMDFAEARRRVEAAAGATLEETYDSFDPKPISSRTAYCVYRAVHKGQPVTVKVRRPGIREHFSADLVAVGWVLWLLEATALYRPGLFQTMSADVASLASEKLDLRNHARYQTVFRRMAKRQGPKWLSAPRIHRTLSNHAVMVGDLIEGVTLARVVRAVEENDVDQLAQFRVMGIDPEVVGRRVLHAAWWSAFENLFFLSGPSAGKILVCPGNRLMFHDFEDSGMLPTTQKRHLREMLERLGDEDISGTARAVVQVMSPLPFIDVFDFTKRIETGLWQELVALCDDQALWWERTTIGLWRTVLRAARENAVNVRLDVLRFMASMLTYDTLVARMSRDLKLLKEFDRYRRRADARAAKSVKRDLEDLDPEDLRSAVIARVSRASEALVRLGVWVETTVENLPVSNLALSGKAAYAVSQFVRMVGVSVGSLAVSVAILSASQLASGNALDLVGAAWRVGGSPWFQLFLCAVAGFTIRRVLFRLDDKGS